MIHARVTDIWIHPESGQPGQALETVQIESEGLAGDRRKKAAVHLVSIEDRADHPRCNVMVDATRDELTAAVGSRVRMGECVLEITGMPSGCPGVYASVVQPGTVRTGDTCVTVMD